jgi:creatinine amidohydrolase
VPPAWSGSPPGEPVQRGGEGGLPVGHDVLVAKRHARRRVADALAGELEVSLLLHGDPELVDDRFRRADWQADARPHLLVTGMRGYTETGVIGRPSLASADKGRAILDSLSRSFKDHLALLS